MEEGDGVISVVLVCRHLSFTHPGPQAIATRPIQARKTQTGYFGVFFDLHAPRAEVEARKK